jgi:type IV pilus assembly protein PilE
MSTNIKAVRSPMRGMTLIELMIAVVIVALLAAVALPAYQSSVRKGRRAEGFTALAAIQQAQERWRGNHAAYGNLNDPADADTLTGIAASTPNGHYALAIANPSATGYTASATAQAAQTADSSCKLLAVRVSNGNLQYGSGGNAIDWSDPGRCWAK